MARVVRPIREESQDMLFWSARGVSGAGNICVVMKNAREASESTSFIPSSTFIHLFIHK